MNTKSEILTYSEVAKVPLGENHEPLVNVTKYSKNIIAQYEKNDMVPIVGNAIFVRDSLARKLAQITEALQKKEGYVLKVVYGYRHPRIQERYFQEQRAKLALSHASLSSNDLDALVHNFVAVPAVAGHPTGGAIDVTLMKTSGELVDMGTRIADYADPEKIKTFSKNITSDAAHRRMVLRDAMLAAGFAPFYGEWWHFSYGDREWACFYGKSKSLYTPIEFSDTSS